MVALPLFKLASLFLRQLSKYGANRIKHQAHEHPSFRAWAARGGQSIHQLNMRMNVALLRDPEAEQRAKEKADAPTVKTAEQQKKEDDFRAKHGMSIREAKEKRKGPYSILNVWKRKFRSLPEAKAVDLFADVVGDAFILTVATALILFEWYRSSLKPDKHAEMIKELNKKLEALEQEREEETKRQESRVLALEEVLRAFKDPKTKKPLLPPAPTPTPTPTTSPS